MTPTRARRTTRGVRVVRTVNGVGLSAVDLAVLTALASAHDGTATATWVAGYTTIARQSVAASIEFLMRHQFVARAGDQQTPRGRTVLFAATMPGRLAVTAAPSAATLPTLVQLAAVARDLAARVDAMMATLNPEAAA